jgi:two-component system response regulator HupR/HoxA
MEKRTVLFVDDEVRVLGCLRGGLLGEPYKTLFASSAKEALEILEKNEVQVIVTDMRMPEMGGLELLRTVKEKYPHIVRMVLSGYTQVTTILTAINQGEIFRFITKPWDFDKEFKPAILEAIEYYDSQNQGDGEAEESEQHKGKQPEKVLEGSE